jgi:hypothetical protein
MTADPQTLGETEQPQQPTPQLAPEPIEDNPPAPAPEPDAIAPEPPEPTGKLTAPETTTGWYLVLGARAPRRGDQERPRYAEVGFYNAPGDAMKAKRLAMEDPANEYLHRSAAQKPGILLRAVPALNWPVEVEATTFDRPAPVLQIR